MNRVPRCFGLNFVEMVMNPAEEKLILDKFRVLVNDLQQDDSTLRRFLRARNYNLQSAETMLRKSIEWRKVHKMDTALTWPKQDIFLEGYPHEYSGLDYKGRVVLYVPLGIWPLREMVEAGLKEEILYHTKIWMEQIECEVKKTGKDQYTLIVDTAESTYWKFSHLETLQIMLQSFRDWEANYPERLAEVWVVNTPFYTNYVWSMLKVVLTGNTASKVTLLSGNEDRYMPVLLERMPESSIPLKLRKPIVSEGK